MNSSYERYNDMEDREKEEGNSVGDSITRT